MSGTLFHKILLIIGNGFDLDLGLETRYSDFLKSSFFTDYCEGSNMSASNLSRPAFEINIFDYLKSQEKIKGWIDVETELANLASREVRFLKNGYQKSRLADASSKEIKTFQQLRISLCDYLKSIEYNNVKPESYGLKLLKILNNDDLDSEIITFNYTEISKLAPIIGDSNIIIPVSYMHGNLESRQTELDDTSIILGFQDDIEIADSYCFMIKSHSPYYTSHYLKLKLDQADEVIFFGHSLGSTDYPYFADFFRKQCTTKPDNEKIKVRIFTYDEQSRQNILVQLRNMNERRTQMLYEYCDFAIYRTKDNIDNEKIENYFSELRRNINSSILF